MESHLRPGENSREPRPAKIDRRSFSATATQNQSLRDRFELDRPCSSHGDTHHRVRNHVRSLPPTAYGNHSKQQTRRVNTTDKDELIKHMSNLPSYLERGKKPQEKAFNVGVLDWSLLEKWQSSKKVPYRRDGDGSSSSNSNSPSLFSAEESSTHSHADQSSSAAHHEHHHHVYQFDLKGFPSEASTSNGKSSHNVSKNQRLSTSESIVKEGSGSKGHCNSNLEREPRRSRRSHSMPLNHKFTDRDEKTFLVMPHNGCPIISASVGSNGAASCKIPEKNERNCTEQSWKAQYSEPSGDIMQSRPLPCDVNDKKSRVLKPCRSQDSKTNDSTSVAGSQQHAIRKPISSSKEGGSKDNPAVLLSALPPVTDLPQGSRNSKPTVDVAKPRYPSPYDRFSFPIRTSSKKSSSTEDAQVLQACAGQAMPTPYIKKDVPAIGRPSCNISDPASKARSSPLKRLLEPVLKQREWNNSRSYALLKKESKPVGRAYEKLDRPSTAPGTRVGLNQDSEMSSSILKSNPNGKDAESAVIQALLQVVVQNGCPFFTFAIENIKEILCAALSQLSTDKTYGDRYLYTFFSIHELKNKSWMNLRGRGNQEYSPNVVAQMEVSETRISNLADHPSTGNNISRQFVLYNVDIKPGEKTELGYQPNDELAAVVVRIPGETVNKAETGKYNGTTVILPSGIHTVPCKGRPSSLIQRWKSGGQCDCGGWDAGCKLMILADSKCQSSSSAEFKLYNQGGAEGKQKVFNLAPFKDKEGLLSVSFSSSISPLQAFSICLATLDAKNSSRPPTPAKVHEAKSVHEICQGDVPGGYFSVPPHSPMGRA